MRVKQLLTIAATTAAVLASPVLGQDGQPETPRDGDYAFAQTATSGKDPHIIQFEFGGGTVKEFISALRKAAGDQPLNIMLDEDVVGLPVPALSLREIDAYTVLRTVQRNMSNPIRLDDGSLWILTMDRIVGEGAPVYQIKGGDVSRVLDRSTVRPNPQRTTIVETITELITGTGAMTADEVLSALQAALAMEEGDEVKLAYHEGTGLVFARVTDEQARVIGSTILNLRVSRESRQERELRDPLESALSMVGARDVNDLVSKVNRADALRNQVLELQRINADQQYRIIELQKQVAELKNFITALESKLKDN